MKKTWVVVLCIVLCLALTLTGTIAYLTEEVSDVNIMTVGRVEVELEEYQRGEDGLEPFQDDKIILPLVGSPDEVDSEYGLPVNKQFVDKIVRVNSKRSSSRAYLRVLIGVPSALEDIEIEGTSIDALHLVMGENVTIPDSNQVTPWPWKEDPSCSVPGVMIDGVSYNMHCFNYEKILEPGETTPVLMGGMYLDPHVDSGLGGEGYSIRLNGRLYPLATAMAGQLQIPVCVQAVQADGFDTLADAFEESGFNEVDFDAKIDLARPKETLTDAVLTLLQKLKRAFDSGSDQKIELSDESYRLSSDTAQEELDQMPFDANGQEVELVVPDGVKTEIQLGDNTLDEGIRITVEGGGELILHAE